MPERNSYPDGAPCWADVMSADPVSTGNFYRGLFGWELEDMGEAYGHYMIASKNGRTVAAITPPPPGGESIPPAWTVYLKSSDVAKTAQAVEKAGGKVAMPPMEVPGQGHMMMAFDPTGAGFGVWQPGGHTGAQLYGEDGALAWAEINTHDGAAADAFYTSVFPLQGQPMPGMDYTVFNADGDMVAGRYRMEDGTAGALPHWMIYFQVADTDTVVASLQKAGGTVVMPARDSDYGRLAIVADPQGARFAVVQPPTA